MVKLGNRKEKLDCKKAMSVNKMDWLGSTVVMLGSTEDL